MPMFSIIIYKQNRDNVKEVVLKTKSGEVNYRESETKPPLQIAGSLLLQGNHRFTTTVLRGEKSSSY